MTDPPIDKLATSAYDPNRKATPMLQSISSSHANLNPVRPSFPAIRPGKGGEELKSKPFRIGQVTITPDGPKCWRIRYRDPETRRDVRRRLSNVPEKDVHAVAININHELMENDGYLPSRPKPLPTIAEGMAEAIRLRNTSAATTRERAGRAVQVVKWLAEKYPRVERWDQIKATMIREMVLDMESRGLSHDSVRLTVAAVKVAWSHMVENYPDRVRPLPTIKIRPRPPREIDCLDPYEVAVFLDWLRENAPALWPMATLQALCGLRILEAAALRAQDIDLKAGTLTVTDTGIHRPKTGNSFRTIPLPDEVAAVLRESMANQVVRPATGELFVNDHGGLWTKSALGWKWRRARQRASRETGLVRLEKIPPRRLRASFATMAGRLGAPDRLLKAYLGHSGGDVLGMYYRRIDLAELGKVSSLMNGWRELVQEPRDGNILAIASSADIQMTEAK